MLGVGPLVEAIQERLSRQYSSVMRHATLRPYTGPCMVKSLLCRDLKEQVYNNLL